jgi:methyltransferase
VPGNPAWFAILGVVVALMIAEAILSRRHERALRTRGAHEPDRDVYPLMRIAYPACFLAMAAEGWVQGLAGPAAMRAGVALFVISKALKYWAIAALEERWTFKVLVPPDAPLVRSGPYAFMRHPNYLAVAGELAAVAIMMSARVAGSIAVIGFTALMLRRIRVEERALARDE